jgi:hypothetical protein
VTVSIGSHSQNKISSGSWQVRVFGAASRQDAFKDSLSTPRFSTYLAAAAHDQDRAIELYFWNSRLAGELIFTLQAFEVCLRNRLNMFLSDRFSRSWPYDTRALRQLTGDDRRRLVRLIADLQTARGGVPPSTDAIVSALSLGFWVSLLTRSYAIPFGWHGPGLRSVFPNDPSLTQVDVFRICNGVRILRNRVAHNEPLIHMPVAQLRADIDRVVGAMCEGTLEFASAGCRVVATLNQRPRP